jgi:F-type H+-transporting ATPase subunit b
MRAALVSSFVCALAVLVGTGAPARAASGKEEKVEPKPTLYVKDGDKFREAKADELPKAGAAGHDSHGGGMLDKLEFTGIKRWDLGLYTLIVFGILMFVLAKYAWPNIKSGLEKREANILGAIEQAKKDRADAEARLNEAKKQLAEAAQQASAVLATARADAEALKVAKQEEGAKEAQAERERAKRETASQMESMRKELLQEVAQLAALMASKALGKQVTLQDQRQLIDDSIAELKANANKA